MTDITTRPSSIMTSATGPSSVIALADHRGRRTLALDMRRDAQAEALAGAALDALVARLDADGLPRGPALRALLDGIAPGLLAEGWTAGEVGTMARCAAEAVPVV